jgi:hypothetical protein
MHEGLRPIVEIVSIVLGALAVYAAGNRRGAKHKEMSLALTSVARDIENTGERMSRELREHIVEENGKLDEIKSDLAHHISSDRDSLLEILRRLPNMTGP